MFHEESIFRRTTSDKWLYTCPVCSKDEYTLNGLCTGSWERPSYMLKAGLKPCRCDTRYNYTQEQWEYRLREISNNRGNIFLSYDKERRCVSWLCSLGHEHESDVRNYLGGKTCREIALEKNKLEHPYIYGYYPERKKKNEQDYLYLLFEESLPYFKTGKSFTPEIRCNRINSDNNLHYQIGKLYTGAHKEIFDLEQRILKEFKNFRIHTEYTTECIDNKAIEDVVKYIEENYVSVIR